MGIDEDNFNEEESGDGSTINHTILEPEVEEDDRLPDRPSTIARKKQFLKLFPRCRLIVTATCREMKMASQTFYIWYDNDPAFADAVEKAREHTNDMVKDLLMEKIKEKETRAITYYLDRRHPMFKPTSKTEVVTGSKTLEDLLKADEEKINDRGNDSKTGENSEGPTILDGEAIQDTRQTRADSSVQTEQDPGVLLEEKDKKESNSEGASKGNIKNHRRGPAPRLHSERN